MEKKKCNWCYKEFLEDREEGKKPYCHACEKRCHRECLRCHKPYTDLRLFTLSDTKCDSCVRSEKKRNKKMKKAYDVTLMEEEGDEEFSSGGSSSEYMSEEEEDQRPTVATTSAADADKTENATKNTATTTEKDKERLQNENQKQMDELMRVLTEHQREVAVEKRPVGKVNKRKYSKRKETAQDKLANIQTDFLKAFFALRKVERSSAGGKPQTTCLFFG